MSTAGSPLILRAKPVADALYTKLFAAVGHFSTKMNRPPTLATILVGDDPASQIYVRKKGEMCHKLGLGHKDYKLSPSTTQNELMAVIAELNADQSIDGILVQKPLPAHINEAQVFDSIKAEKDVDCFSPYSVGLLVQGRAQLLPCTPAGVMEILKFYKIPLSGKNALVIGRSDIVGKPMGLLFLQASATVSYAHSKTKDLAQFIEHADIVVAAIGKAQQFKGDLPWKTSATVIDVGINRLTDGTLAGDIDYSSVAPQVGAITPVPGGVGPMTIAMLMVNTVRAAYLRESIPLSF